MGSAVSLARGKAMDMQNARIQHMIGLLVLTGIYQYVIMLIEHINICGFQTTHLKACWQPMNVYQKKIYQYLLDGIASGGFKCGARIPKEIELAEIFETSRLNAHYAVKRLVDAGLIARKKHCGSSIIATPSNYTMTRLKSYASRRICVLNQLPAHYSHIHMNEKLIAPLEIDLRARGIDLEFKDASRISDSKGYRKALLSTLDEGCNGILLIANGADHAKGVIAERIEMLSELHDNIFVFDPAQNWTCAPCNTVSSNLFREGVLAANRLLSRGYRKILFCGRRWSNFNWVRERARGAECAVKRNGDGAFSALISDQAKEFRIPFSELEPGSAIIAETDEFAASIVDESAKRGIKFGREIGLISFDDNSHFLNYSLTSVAPALGKIGERLATMIAETLEGACGEVSHVAIDPVVIDRKTCDGEGLA